MKAYQIIRKDAKGFEPDWNNFDQLKYIGGFYREALTIKSIINWQDLGQIYFETLEDIEESQRIHQQEWLTLIGAEKGDND